MSWFKTLRKNIAVLGALCLLLSACGFQPLHGTKAQGAQVTALYKTVEISNIPDRDGQYLRNLLIDRLHAEGKDPAARYLLSVARLDKNITSLGIRKDATATRGQMEVTARMRLIDKSTGKAVLERDLRAVGGYNRLDNQFATIVSEVYSTEIVLKELAEAIMTELDLHFRRENDRP
jgi:LPS-assembly lipoprotein